MRKGREAAFPVAFFVGLGLRRGPAPLSLGRRLPHFTYRYTSELQLIRGRFRDPEALHAIHKELDSILAVVTLVRISWCL